MLSFIEQVNLTTVLDKVYNLLALQGKQGYIVGGFIRDWLLGKETNDVDIAVDGDAIDTARKVAQALEGKFVLLDEVNRVARVVLTKEEQHYYLDFSSFWGDIVSDLARRDFTMNAMATPLGQMNVIASKAKQSQLKLIDPFSGKEDLRDRVVRAVSEQIFESDAVRLLRAVRLAAELDFAIEPKTECLIQRYAQSIAKIPGERVREELLRLLSLPRAAYRLRYLDELGLLLALVPELRESKGVEQPTVHFWDVFDHSVETVAAVEFLIRESRWEYGNEDMLAVAPWSDMLSEHLSREVSHGSNHKALLKLGALLHDIAKPGTKFLDAAGRAHFYGHTKQGADMAAVILERLRFSNREINLVESLVYHHLRPFQMANQGLPTKRAIYRYFRDTDDAGIDILFLALADYLATYGPLLDVEEWKEQCRLIDYILKEYAEQQIKVLPVKLVSGYDLMDAFGLTPGPLIGKLLAVVQEAQASGEVATKEKALALVRSVILRERSDRRISGKIPRYARKRAIN
jgi:poly(A) polymerase